MKKKNKTIRFVKTTSHIVTLDDETKEKLNELAFNLIEGKAVQIKGRSNQINHVILVLYELKKLLGLDVYTFKKLKKEVKEKLDL